ncbi:MAG TPA: heavy-metal-associated domain-containing protein [Chitinophagaceae bacterium]|nr:heavy-metal-associated domain-containing protein [Chitinophagaceae bacterium]
MKNVFSLFLFLVLTSGIHAQQKQVVTVKINTPTVQGQPCKERLEQFLKYEEGVARVIVDFRKKITTITYHTERTNIENLKTAIANQGFDADDIKANPESYNKLPTACKKPEDRPENKVLKNTKAVKKDN